METFQSFESVRRWAKDPTIGDRPGLSKQIQMLGKMLKHEERKIGNAAKSPQRQGEEPSALSAIGAEK